MLFSKYPLGSLGTNRDLDVPNAVLSGTIPNLEFSGWCVGNHSTYLPYGPTGSPNTPLTCPWKENFGWGYYVERDGDDAWANKGVGLVRILGPGRPLDLAFTHTQADYPETGHYYQAVRASQFDTIKRLISNRGAQRSTFGDVDTLLVGDLNVEGLGSAFGATAANPNAMMLSSEYGQKLWGQFEGMPFYDVWRTTSPEDDGPTHRGSQVARLDYMLLDGAGYHNSVTPWSPSAPAFDNPSVDFTCPQYIRRAFADGPSDHVGLILDLGPRSAHCRPDRARRPETEGNWNVEKRAILTDELPEAGSVMWYRVDAPGTYSLGFRQGSDAAQHLRFEVYPANDLSRVLAAKDSSRIVDGCAGQLGVPCNFQVSPYFTGEQPFYIRVFDPQGLRTGVPVRPSTS